MKKMMLVISMLLVSSIASAIDMVDSCDTPMSLDPERKSYSGLVFPTSGTIKKNKVFVAIEAEMSPSEHYELMLIYGSMPVHLGTFRNSVYMTMDLDAPELCEEVCKNGCGSPPKEPGGGYVIQTCKPPQGFEIFERVNPAYHQWKLGVETSSGTEALLKQWSLMIDLDAGDDVSPTEKFWGGIAVGLSEILCTVAFVMTIIQGFRNKSYGMPLFGQAAFLGLTILMVYPGPAFEPCLFSRVLRVPIQLGLNAHDPTFMIWVWRIGLVIQGVVFVQYLWWGRRIQPSSGFRHDFFFPIAIGSLILVTAMQFLFIVYYQDFYINDSYPIATMVLAVTYIASLWDRENLAGLSVSAAWMFAIGTLLMYVGIVIGFMEEAFHDHLDTGFGFAHAVYVVATSLMFGYAIGLTRRYRSRPDGLTRPSL